MATDANPAFARVGLVAKSDDPDLAAALHSLRSVLRERGIEPEMDAAAALAVGGEDEGVERSVLAERVDLLVVLGGDGTLLSVAPSAAAAGVPVFGVNYGGLGFLTATPPGEALAGLTAVLAGSFESSSRRLLRAEIRSADGATTASHDVLNDAVLNKTDLARIVALTATVNGDLVSTFAADGLIVCSTTGSTAYSLAAGGPIVMPEVDAIVLTPICPHTLTNRPLVLPGDAEVQIQHEDRRTEVILTLDGQLGLILEPGDSVTVRRSPHALQLLQPVRRSYFDILRAKLQWGTR